MSQSTDPTLMDALKTAIHEQHKRMEELPFIAALSSGQLPLESYVGQLRSMALIHGTLEHELALMTSGEIKSLMLSVPSRLVHIRKDLSVFDHKFIPDIEESLGYARKIAERIRRYRVEQSADLLGILYVLQGSTLGNAVHLPDVLRIFGSQTSGTAHYYSGYGQQTARYWKEFCHAMNALAIDKDGRNRIIQAALDFFDQLELLYSALYPIDSAKMVFTAGMLNPEAGDHQIPGDVREMEAAVVAAQKCREEFPYLDERYQERGRSFARSDAAWLASLAELPLTQLLSQVEWLGRVLANRGMPRITLERQLELLHGELSAAVPDKMDRYHGLLEAAESLKQERLRIITEQAFRKLAEEFDSATDGESKGRFRRTGELIISAVCDEEAGIADSVSSLVSWLTDEERFTPKWISEVSNTLKRAREIVGSKKRT